MSLKVNMASKDFEDGLLPDLQEFLGGVAMRDLPRLRDWIGALRLLRCCERETEVSWTGVA